MIINNFFALRLTLCPSGCISKCTAITNHSYGRGKVSAKLSFVENISYMRTREHLQKLMQNLIKTVNKAGP